MFLRPGEFVFHRWLSVVGLDKLFTLARQSGTSSDGFIPDWILYSLPNGFWAFAYYLLITGIWQGSSSPLRYFWFATIPILVLGFEFLQGAGIIRGIFSLMDLAFVILGMLLGALFELGTRKKCSYEKDLN